MSVLVPFELFNNFLWQAIPIFLEGLVYFVYASPILLALLLWQTYLLFIRSKYIKDQEWVLLEIKIPKEITKSPRAMELLLEIFYQTYEGELIDRFIKGSIRGWFSLEIVSIGGKIHFYMCIPKFFHNLVESRIYSQYPEVEVIKCDHDYTEDVTYGQPGSPWQITGREFKLDKNEIYPIRTYIDYELDKDPKEEFKIDPMTPMLEFLSSIKPTEQVWYQILIMGGKKRFGKDSKTGKALGWQKMVEKELSTLLQRNAKPADMSSAWIKSVLSPGEREMVEAVERNLKKLPFDTGLRVLYASTTGIRPQVKVGLLSSLRQYSYERRNAFAGVDHTITGFNNPWQDPFGWRTKKREMKHFKYYRNRSYFYPPASRKPMTLTTEELATIYHFPGQVATTPSLERIQSKRGEPPANLPI
jgi:hypothetical protein